MRQTAHIVSSDDFDKWAQKASSGGAAAGGTGGGGQRRAPRPTARRSSPRATPTPARPRAGPATRSPTARTTGTTAPTSTRCSRARTRRSSRSRSWTPKEIAPGIPGRDHAPQLRRYASGWPGRRPRRVPRSGAGNEHKLMAVSALPSTAPPATVAACAPGWSRRRPSLADRRRLRLRARHRPPRCSATTRCSRGGRPAGRADRRAVLLPRRPRAFDYWFHWAAGKPTRRRGPLRPRRQEWKRLLHPTPTTRSSAIQYVVHVVHLHVHRRPDGDADARRARRAGAPVRRREHLQRPVQRPRLAADLPVRHPGVRRAWRTSSCR